MAIKYEFTFTFDAHAMNRLAPDERLDAMARCMKRQASQATEALKPFGLYGDDDSLIGQAAPKVTNVP